MTTLAGQIRRRIAAQPQASRPRRNVGGKGLDPCMAIRSKKCRVLPSRKPFCVEDPITQAENGRNELCQLLARSKGVVPQPSPANAFGEHITDFSGTCGIVQMNFINSLEADVHSLRGLPSPLQAQLACLPVGRDPRSNITPSFKILV